MRIQPVIMVILVALLVCTPLCCAAGTTDSTKAILVTYQYKDGKITTISSRVVYGYPPNNVGGTDIRVDLKGKNGAVLGSFGIDDPRILYHEEGADLQEEVVFTVLLPFSTDASSVSLYESRSGAVMATTDISSAISSFCASHPNDPQCGAAAKPTQAGIGYGIVLAAGAGATLLMRRRG
ncbi:MAG TPA: hypothetical protein PK069_07530 [Methanolinea sp.]|nr:hypothetical protein [Methanolinea sp.]HQK56178.1 hypothetical protein [Methanolinea sp.]